MNCKRCGKKVTDTAKQFCSMDCRNVYVSDMMIKKAKKIKREFGNSYYLKKEEANG